MNKLMTITRFHLEPKLRSTLIFTAILYALTVGLTAMTRNWGAFDGTVLMLYVNFGLFMGMLGSRRLTYVALQNGVNRQHMGIAALTTFTTLALVSTVCMAGWRFLARQLGEPAQLFISLMGYQGELNGSVLIANFIIEALLVLVAMIAAYWVGLVRELWRNGRIAMLVGVVILLVGVQPIIHFLQQRLFTNFSLSVLMQRLVNGNWQRVQSGAQATPWLLVGVGVIVVAVMVGVTLLIGRSIEARSEVAN